jgi:hypothetical protein
MAKNDFIDMDLKNGFQLGENTGSGPEPTMSQDLNDAANAELMPKRFVEPCKQEAKKVKNWKQRPW